MTSRISGWAAPGFFGSLPGRLHAAAIRRIRRPFGRQSSLRIFIHKDRSSE
jgi:hypothetical protein